MPGLLAKAGGISLGVKMRNAPSIHLCEAPCQHPQEVGGAKMPPPPQGPLIPLDIWGHDVNGSSHLGPERGIGGGCRGPFLARHLPAPIIPTEMHWRQSIGRCVRCASV